MNDWTNDFISQCLEDVPPGKYRVRAEAELRDHLLSLAQELEGAGYSPEEARAIAQARMGDPAELARRYLRAWRRRSLSRWGVAAEMLLYALCISAVGCLYVWNCHNFGKSVVALWGIAVIPAAALSALFALMGAWTTARWSCLLLAAFHPLPVWCWSAFSGTLGFEMSGVMVPGWAGALVHLLLFLWAVCNYCIIAQVQQENTEKVHSA